MSENEPLNEVMTWSEFQEHQGLRLSRLIGQGVILEFIKALRYPHYDEEGMCDGISAMSEQAFLMNDIEAFNERLIIMCWIHQTCKKNNISIPSKLDQMQQLMLSLYKDKNYLEAKFVQSVYVGIYAFCDGVALYSRPDQSPDLFQKGEFIKHLSVQDIIKPVKLFESSAHIQSFGKIGASYTQDELKTFLTCVSLQLTAPCTISIRSSEHQFSVHYDPNNKKFLLVDPNQLPGCAFNIDQDGLQALSLAIFEVIKLIEHSPPDRFVFGAQFSCHSSNIEQLSQNLSIMYESPLWNELQKSATQEVEGLNSHGQNVIECCARNNDTLCIQGILEAHHHQNKLIPLSTSLCIAASEGHLEAVNMLLHYQADIKTSLWEDASALDYATQNGHIEVLKVLLNHGADMNQRNEKDHFTPVMLAVELERVDLVKAFFEYAETHQIQINKKELLDIAIEHNHLEMSILLLAEGANITRRIPIQLKNIPPESIKQMMSNMGYSSESKQMETVLKKLNKAGLWPIINTPEHAAQAKKLQSNVERSSPALHFFKSPSPLTHS